MKHMLRNFPGSPLVKNPGANAGNMGSISGLGTKITHAARQLTLCIRLPTLNSRVKDTKRPKSPPAIFEDPGAKTERQEQKQTPTHTTT